MKISFLLPYLMPLAAAGPIVARANSACAAHFNASLPSADPSRSGGKHMIDSINDFRKAAGLPLQSWDTTLVANAAKTGQSTNGKSMRHQMNPGTMAQVLAMGTDDDGKCSRDFGGYTPFELYYLSWLCEVPGGPGLNGRCPNVLRMSRIASGGQTGHYKILSAKNYGKIGCAFTRNPEAGKCSQMSAWTGIWACDLR